MESEDKFEENEVDALLLWNMGGMLLVYLGVVLIYVTIILIAKYGKKLGILQDLCKKIRKTLEWSGIIRIWIASYLELTIAGLLQIF